MIEDKPTDNTPTDTTPPENHPSIFSSTEASLADASVNDASTANAASANPDRSDVSLIAPSSAMPVKLEKFSLDDALKEGWTKCWTYFWPYVGICTATFLLASIPQIATFVINFINSSPTMIMIGLLLSLFGLIMQYVVMMGYVNLQLRVLDGLPITTRDVFTVFNRFWPFLGAATLYALMCGAGFICFIVPGIILHIKFQFYSYFVIEQKMGPIQALKASSKLTEGVKMDLFLFSIVQWFIGSAGMMMLMVGSFPAWLINSISTASVYRQMLQHIPELQMGSQPTSSALIPATLLDPAPDAASNMVSDSASNTASNRTPQSPST